MLALCFWRKLERWAAASTKGDCVNIARCFICDEALVGAELEMIARKSIASQECRASAASSVNEDNQVTAVVKGGDKAFD